MKKLFYCCFFLITAQFVSQAIASTRTNISCNSYEPIPKHKLTAPPPNDDCSGAYPVTINTNLSCTNVVSGTIANATQSAVITTACDGSEDDDVWFSFVATQNQLVINLINIQGSTADLFHSLWTGGCNNMSLVPNSCSDPNYSTPSNLVVGQTYYLRVYSYGIIHEITSFDVCIGTLPLPPINDECSGAIAVSINSDLTCSNTTPGTITAATASPVDTVTCGGSEDDDVWFSFVATQSTHRISLINIQGTTTDLYHSVWTGGCNNIYFVAGSCSDPNISQLSGLTIGQTYYIRVYSFTIITGQIVNFDICISSPPTATPPNDNCDTGQPLTVGNVFNSNPIMGTNLSATYSNPPNPGCGFYTSNDVWYTVSVPNSGNITIETGPVTGSNLTNTAIAAYSGSCSGTLTPVACNDDNGIGSFSKII